MHILSWYHLSGDDGDISIDIVLSDDDGDISIDIVMSLSPLLLIESDGRDIIPIEDIIPNNMKPKPVILAIQSPPLAQTFSAKIIAETIPSRKYSSILVLP